MAVDRCNSFGDKTGLRLDLTIHPCYLGSQIPVLHTAVDAPAGPQPALAKTNGDSCNVSGCYHVAIAVRYHAMPPLRSAPIGPVQTATLNSKAPGRSSLRITQCCLQCHMSPSWWSGILIIRCLYLAKALRCGKMPRARLPRSDCWQPAIVSPHIVTM